MTTRLRWSLVLLFVSTLAAPACHRDSEGLTARASHEAPPSRPEPPVERDLGEIGRRGELVMLTPTNSTSYFIYRGEPLGYEYELLKQFAAARGLALRVEVVADTKTILERLNRGDGDIAAGRLARTEDGERLAAFTHELYRTDPVLVQQDEPVDESKLPEGVKETLDREAPGASAPTDVEVRTRLVQKPWELAGEAVDVPEKSAYARTLVELEDEISGDISVVEVASDDEQLVKRVAEGEVGYTVAQANLAELKQAEYTNLRIKPILGRPHRVAWAVRQNAPELLAALDAWIDSRKDDKSFAVLYGRYFGNRRAYKERAKSEYLTHVTGRLSRYDDLLKLHAPEIAWDWRLLASQAYQESRFEPDAKSWAGALGLLQLMPATARQVGVTDPLSPDDNVRGAVKYLGWLKERWSRRIPDEAEQLKFILASYNCGSGHVEDAQRLAEKYGGDQALWRDVAYWLLEKSKSEIAANPCCKFGFCRGIEPVTYVEKILGRFEHYKQFVKE